MIDGEKVRMVFATASAGRFSFAIVSHYLQTKNLTPFRLTFLANVCDTVSSPFFNGKTRNGKRLFTFRADL